MTEDNQKPTLKEVLDDEQAKQDYPTLRRLLGEITRPNHTSHAYTFSGQCRKCGKTCWSLVQNRPLPALKEPCIPDSDTRHMEAITLGLARKCEPEKLRDAVLALGDWFKPDVGIDEPEWMLWWIFEATPEQQAVCALVALDKVEIPKKQTAKPPNGYDPNIGPGDNVYVYG